MNQQVSNFQINFRMKFSKPLTLFFRQQLVTNSRFRRCDSERNLLIQQVLNFEFQQQKII